MAETDFARDNKTMFQLGAQIGLEFRFMELLKRIEPYLADQLDRIMLIVAYAIIGLILWRLVRPRRRIIPGTGRG